MRHQGYYPDYYDVITMEVSFTGPLCPGGSAPTYPTCRDIGRLAENTRHDFARSLQTYTIKWSIPHDVVVRILYRP